MKQHRNGHKVKPVESEGQAKKATRVPDDAIEQQFSLNIDDYLWMLGKHLVFRVRRWLLLAALLVGGLVYVCARWSRVLAAVIDGLIVIGAVLGLLALSAARIILSLFRKAFTAVPEIIQSTQPQTVRLTAEGVSFSGDEPMVPWSDVRDIHRDARLIIFSTTAGIDIPIPVRAFERLGESQRFIRLAQSYRRAAR